MMPRSTKHTRIPPTREIFAIANRGTEANEKGVHNGYLINDQDEYAQIEFMVPHDYHGFYECALVFISSIDLATMTINIESDYAQPGELCTLQSQGAFQFSKNNVGTNKIDEIDITNLINGDATTRAIMRGDYVGIQAQRTGLQNADALILGVRFRYTVFKHK